MDVDWAVGAVAGVMSVVGGVLGALTQRHLTKKHTPPPPPAPVPPPATRKKYASKSGSPFDPVA